MSEPILSTRDLTRTFTQGETVIDVLCGVDFMLHPGEIVALLGPSGSGKSTFLQAVGLLEGGFGGEIVIAGQAAQAMSAHERTLVRRESIGFIYQFHHLLPDFTALENVMMPQLVRGDSSADAAGRSHDLLASLGLAERTGHKPAQLSGGEQQRVAVARALATRPQLILADEPTGNLDERTADVVFAQFMDLIRSQGSAALVATHNERLAERMDRVVRLHEGVLE